jgi:anthranilate synthase component 1
MHIVSQVEAVLQPDLDSFDLFRATFPAGTVSGAPKVRAMEIVAEQEPTQRGPYAGALGYVGYDGNMDMAITIRTLLMDGDRASAQAGAGIVYDSVPEREYRETLSKAASVMRAVELAESGLDLAASGR